METYIVLIKNQNNEIVTETKLRGSNKTHLLDLGNCFLNIISSLEPEKYSNCTPYLKPV